MNASPSTRAAARTALVQHDADLWSAEHQLRWPAGLVPIPVRMTVLRLRDRQLILHSPIPISAELRQELESLGPVGFIVVPHAHGKFAAEAAQAFPSAQLIAAPAPPASARSLPFRAALPDQAPAAWTGEVESLLVRGFRLREVLLYQRSSRTLVITDLCFNVQRSSSSLARAFFRLDGMWQRFAPSLIIRAVGISDRAGFRSSLEQVQRWDFERIIPGHGDVLEHGGPAALRAAWLARDLSPQAL